MSKLVEKSNNLNDTISSTYVRASNVISREPYDIFAEPDNENAEDDVVQHVVEQNVPNLPNGSENKIDDILDNVVRQVNAEIKECLEQGRPFISILRSPPGHGSGGAKKRHRRQRPADEAMDPEYLLPPPRKSQRAGRRSERVGDLGVRWMQTPHAVSVSRGMSGPQPLRPFDDTRVMQAYRLALWQDRARRFGIPLDVNDPTVQQSLHAVQAFDFQAASREGVDPDPDERSPQLPDD
ncbi:uncharacterized protein LOC144167539 [Haemaphysalis longicornis]